MGLDDTNSIGVKAGVAFFENMLAGMTVSEAFNTLPASLKNEKGVHNNKNYDATLYCLPSDCQITLFDKPEVTEEEAVDLGLSVKWGNKNLGASTYTNLGNSYEDYDYDPYAYVTREIPADGVSYSQQFAQGDYVVGVHIPEGTYVMEGQGDNYISLSVDDAENGIYLYESVDDEVTSVDDIRLYTGAVVSISGDGYLTLSADNAQAEQTTGGLPNPLTESVRISGGQTLTVGEDFPAGVYDLSAVSGYGAPEITICDQEGNELQTLYPWLTDSSETESIYRNVVLPQGAVFSNTDEELELELVPSETIVSEDYLGYYDRY